MKNGYSESKTYMVKGDGEESGDASVAGESYYARLCEQSASGGGWTVKKMNAMLLLLLPPLALLLVEN